MKNEPVQILFFQKHSFCITNQNSVNIKYLELCQKEEFACALHRVPQERSTLVVCALHCITICSPASMAAT